MIGIEQMIQILLEQVLRADAAVVMNALDGVSKQSSNADNRCLGAASCVEWDRIAENHLLESAVHDALASRLAHDGV